MWWLTCVSICNATTEAASAFQNAENKMLGRTHDTVEHPGADEAHGVSVDGSERALGERPGLVGVVRNEGVGVLEEGDSDKEVVHDEVGQDVCGEKNHEPSQCSLKLTGGEGTLTVASDVLEAVEIAGGAERSDQDGDTEVRHDDLRAVSLVEDDGVRVEVVRGALGVVELSRSVLDEIGLPSKELTATK